MAATVRWLCKYITMHTSLDQSHHWVTGEVVLKIHTKVFQPNHKINRDFVFPGGDDGEKWTLHCSRKTTRVAVCSLARNSGSYCHHSLSFAVITLGAPQEELLTQYLLKQYHWGQVFSKYISFIPECKHCFVAKDIGTQSEVTSPEWQSRLSGCSASESLEGFVTMLIAGPDFHWGELGWG